MPCTESLLYIHTQTNDKWAMRVHFATDVESRIMIYTANNTQLFRLIPSFHHSSSFLDRRRLIIDTEDPIPVYTASLEEPAK